MTEVKKPQDHKKAGGEKFTFEHKGQSYTFAETFDAVTSPKWIRENRRRTEEDQLFTMLEEVAGDECIKVIDSMERAEFRAFYESMGKAIREFAEQD
jgi:hypothetical protein